MVGSSWFLAMSVSVVEGDYVVVKKQKTCKNGDIAVALVDGDEATLKRFYKDGNRIRLEPANSKMKPIYSTNVQVMGVVVGVIRKY